MGCIPADWEEDRLGTGFPIVQTHGGQSIGFGLSVVVSSQPLPTSGSVLASLITLYPTPNASMLHILLSLVSAGI